MTVKGYPTVYKNGTVIVQSYNNSTEISIPIIAHFNASPVETTFNIAIHAYICSFYIFVSTGSMNALSYKRELCGYRFSALQSCELASMTEPVRNDRFEYCCKMVKTLMKLQLVPICSWFPFTFVTVTFEGNPDEQYCDTVRCQSCELASIIHAIRLSCCTVTVVGYAKVI